MLRTLLNIFSPKPPTPHLTQGSATVEVRPIEAYYLDELKLSEFFKKEAQQAIMDHLTGKRSLTKTPNKLSVEQKRGLGINTRIAITQEVINVLTPDGMAEDFPRELLSHLHLRATFLRSWDDTVKRATRIGTRQFRFRAETAPDGCEWCVRVAANKIFNQEIVSEIKANCKCSPYSRGYVEPILPDFD